MRHKQRPTKSSRHKSVTFIVSDSAAAAAAHTSFGGDQPASTSPTKQHQQLPSTTSPYVTKPTNVSSPRALPPRSTVSLTPATGSQLAPGPSKSLSVSFLQQAVGQHQRQQQQQQQQQQQLRHNSGGSSRMPIVMAANEPSEEQQHSSAIMRKFEHNYRHMSDVMRLAFLENNDISIDDCANIDFNSLSTASILQRNIQQQLQQERRDQLQFHKQQQHHLLQQQHELFRQPQSVQQLQDMALDDDFDNDDYYDDVSDSRIFATATSGSSADQLPLLGAFKTSSNMLHQHQQQHHHHQQQQQPRQAQRHQSQSSGGSLIVDSSPSTSRSRNKRPRDSNPNMEYEAPNLDDSMKNFGDGSFYCDEPGCGKSFPSQRKLRHHKVVHSDEFPFVCEFNGCNKKFKRKFGIDLHSTTHFDLDPEMYSKTSNNSSLPFFGRRMQYSMCKPCGQKFKTVHDYQYHMVKHGKEPFKCPVKNCGQTFGIWKSFQKHRASHYFNYFCKMDPQCDHHTSNLQLLKLHIYCCHFKRQLPENATLSAKDHSADEPASRDDPIDVVDNEDNLEISTLPDEGLDDDEDNFHQQQQQQPQLGEDEEDIEVQEEVEEQQVEMERKPQFSHHQEPALDVTPTRRDSRLRKNPPRTFEGPNYASVNNGSISFKSPSSSIPHGTRRTRVAPSSISVMQTTGSQSTLHSDRKIKLPSKISLDKSEQQQQQLSMSLMGDDELATDDFYDDLSDSRIFATANSGSSGSQIPVLGSYKSSSELIQQHQQQQRLQQSQSSDISLDVSGTGSPGTSGSRSKRARDSSQYSDYSNIDDSIKNFGDGSFYCDEPGCGKSFPSQRKLRHHKVVHSDEFPFVCEFNGCNKKFKRKFGIDLHSTTHFDLDPEMYSKTSNNSSLPFFGRRMQYSMCKPCGQKFKTVHDYQYHMLKHGKEPFKCPVKNCGQTFGIWKSFQKHRASHYFNYFCKMDPQCDHHTSNLQLLKLHIYCCHFKRQLPENATLSAKDPSADEPPSRDDSIDVLDVDDNLEISDLPGDERVDDEVGEEEGMEAEEGEQVEAEEEEEEQQQQMQFKMEPMEASDEPAPDVTPSRRDSRLRKNPPRTFDGQNYASVNNGSISFKSQPSTPQSGRRGRGAGNSNNKFQATSVQSATTSDRKIKLPPKPSPKKSAQRIPIPSLAGDEASTEDDEREEEIGDDGVGAMSDDGSMPNDYDEEDMEQDPTKRNKFKCHLCEYKFSVRFQLTKHLSTHLELTPEMFSATANKQAIQLSERRRREYYCDKCNVKFESMADLDSHMRKHGNKPYVCNFCQTPSIFRLAKQYLGHLYEHRYNYRCTMAPDCDFTINRKDALKLHIFRMHLNQQLPSYIENFANLIDCNEWSDAQ